MTGLQAIELHEPRDAISPNSEASVDELEVYARTAVCATAFDMGRANVDQKHTILSRPA
jgi:hypothetical protein